MNFVSKIYLFINQGTPDHKKHNFKASFHRFRLRNVQLKYRISYVFSKISTAHQISYVKFESKIIWLANNFLFSKHHEFLLRFGSLGDHEIR